MRHGILKSHNKNILITGHEGLVGRHLWRALASLGHQLVGLDLVATNECFRGDIQESQRILHSLSNVSGVIHLAAVSRVIWAQQDPELCWATNAVASRKLLDIACDSPSQPWVLVVSSREVYGESPLLPVMEDAPLVPINVYGEAKVAMEQAAIQARNRGLNTAIVRLANVYGCPLDHRDRVIPAFCHAAVRGETLRVEGMEHLFDFTHISDVVTGILRMVNLLNNDITHLPAIHLLPGTGTTLGEAARLAVAAAGTEVPIVMAPPRKYDVCRFVGDPGRAREILNWKAAVSPAMGIRMFVELLKNEMKSQENCEVTHENR